MVGKIHGILAVTGQSSRVSGGFVRENECYISRAMSTRNDVLWRFKAVDYRMSSTEKDGLGNLKR